MSRKNSTLKKIRVNFASLEDIRLFARIFFLITLLPVILRLMSLPRLLKMLTPRDLRVCHDPDPETKAKIVKFTEYLLGRNFWMYKNTCLKRSLVLYHMLRRSKIDVQLCLGVRPKAKPSAEMAQMVLEGHAWLLYKGNIFLERDMRTARTYLVTYSFPDMMGQQI